MLETFRVVVQIFQGYGEKLTYNDEVYQVFDVTDVKVANKALHLDI